MSRIGKKPINLPEGVKIEVSKLTFKVSGPKGTVEKKIPEGVTILVNDSIASVATKGETKLARSIHGTIRATLADMVKGVTTGWSKVLELSGTGYKAEVSGSTLTLALGFSHPVKVVAPEGISFTVEKTLVTVHGADRELVGEVAANLKKIRPPDPYKAKGIKYQGEEIKRKAGKAAKVGAPGGGA